MPYLGYLNFSKNHNEDTKVAKEWPNLIRVTWKFNKNLPNIWKCSQNCYQTINAKIESPQHLHPTPFDG